MKIAYKIITITACITLVGCKDFLKIDPPKNAYVPETVFSTPETANSAILSIIGRMSVGAYVTGYPLSFLTGISGDELTNVPVYTSDIYRNIINPRTSEVNGIWTNGYNLIYAANAAYENTEKSTTISANLKKQIMAEALFIRAYWHFVLVNLYGDIPIVTNIDYTKNSNLSRQPVTVVYEQIISDLKYAKQNLNEHYVGADGLNTVSERVRPNKAAAAAFLARVYLFAGQFINAEAMATSVISSSDYILEPIDNVFLKESKEAIWQVMPVNNSFYNTQEGQSYIPTLSPLVEGKATISEQLLNAFEIGDNRKISWIGTYVDVATNVSYHYPFKYKIRGGENIKEYSIVLRLAEQYLIRAEARIVLGNTIGAVEDINAIRNRAGLEKLSANTPSELLSSILKERQVELFSEYGHRWFDLKRTGVIDAIMPSVTAKKGGDWETTCKLWPIPYNELLNAPNLTQNPGYK